MSNQNQNLQIQKAPDVKVEESSTTCVVGCKLASGLHLDMKDKDGHNVRYTLKGTNAARIIGGYGLTDGIPREFMEAWLKRNADHPAVKAGAVFMHTKVDSARGIANERREVTTGLEPIDPLRDGKKRGLDMDAAALAAYSAQVENNPSRNRQTVE